VRTCVIFNPAARGSKARHFRHHLGEMAGQSAFKATTAPGDARRLAAEAVADGFELVVAAGGDGTVNEVLNGIGDAPDGFDRARFGVLPLGTVNVFARELKIPLKLERAWEILRRGRETRIDLPRAEFSTDGKNVRRYFAQLAGAGFDARAIELVNWPLKKKIGPLAYVVAGLNHSARKRRNFFRRVDFDRQRNFLRRVVRDFSRSRFAQRPAGSVRGAAREFSDAAALRAEISGAAATAGQRGAALRDGGD